jgi:acetoacetyl-CoA synthetase
MTRGERLWQPTPERVAGAGITRFQRWLEAERGLRFDDYESLWRWSVQELEAFWEAVWLFCGVRGHAPWTRVLDRRAMPGARWFEGAALNFAEHVLAPALRPAPSPGEAGGGPGRGLSDAAGRPVIVFESEARARSELTGPELAALTGALGSTLERLGVSQGDRVAAYLPNVPEAVVAFLAAASGGAIWSSSSPEMGASSVIDRFRQIGPKVLFAVDGYRYAGKEVDRRATVRDLVRRLPTVEAVILVPHLDAGASLDDVAVEGTGRRVPVIGFGEAVARPAPPRFLPVPFDHPLWVVYSSGTSGLPKPIVHGHGGALLENLKAATFHLDVGPTDRFFWFASTNWIMWNVWVSVLATGCTALQLDGSPSYPDTTRLWRFAERERATFFGTSPAFLALSMKAGLRPRAELDLGALRTVGVTGSPLSRDAYRWIYEQVHPDVLVAAISGGTDVCAAFLTSSPTLPVHAGEMQCRGLGVAVESFDDAGQPLLDSVGELVVTQPMPSMPLYFWGDQDGSRYRESYFETYPGCWRHGDWLRLVPRPESVTAIVYGRSDSTINRHGVRMGTSEIYRVVESFPEVADALVVDLEHLDRPSYLALFVVLSGGPAAVPPRGPAPDGEEAGRGRTTGVPSPLRDRLLAAIRSDIGPRHVPDEVFAVPEVPRTISGKKMEVPVKRILLGHDVERCASRDSMANPASLDWYLGFARGRAAG